MTIQTMVWLHENVFHLAFGVFLISAVVVFYTARNGMVRTEVSPEEDVLLGGCLMPLLFVVVGALAFGVFWLSRLAAAWTVWS